MSMNNRITWELGLSDNAEGCISPYNIIFKIPVMNQACQAVSINAINPK